MGWKKALSPSSSSSSFTPANGLLAPREKKSGGRGWQWRWCLWWLAAGCVGKGEVPTGHVGAHVRKKGALSTANSHFESFQAAVLYRYIVKKA